VTALTDSAGAGEHLQAALRRVRSVAADTGVAGVVLTAPGPVAWVTGGLNQPIDRTAAVDVVWLAVSADGACVITTEVEAPRLAAEYGLDALGLDLIAVPWWDAPAFVEAATKFVGRSADALGTDGHPAFGVDLGVALTRERLALDPWEQGRLRELGQDAADAVETALREWEPGEPDRDVAARIAAAVEWVGAQAPVLLVGGDDRLRRFRHPVAVGQPLHEVVMAVLVAARDGQHVALTRYVAAHPLDRPGDHELTEGLDAVRRIHRRTLAASQPGATTADVLAELADAYVSEGAAGAWSQHYQGGPIGYAQREFEVAPGQVDSAYWSTPLPEGSAVAWNPSLPGGAKDEDTFLVRAGVPEPVTLTTQWPLADDLLPARPAVLVLGL